MVFLEFEAHFLILDLYIKIWLFMIHGLRRTVIPVGGEIAPTPSGQNGSYRPGKPLFDQQVNSSLRFRSV